MKKNTKTILKSLMAMMMVLALAGCSSTPTTPSATPETTATPEASAEATATPEGEVVEEGNTLLIPLFVKDPEAGAKYDADVAQLQVNITSDTVDVNTITALDINAFYDASACEANKECKVQVQLEVTNDAIDPATITMTPNVTEATVIVTK